MTEVADGLRNWLAAVTELSVLFIYALASAIVLAGSVHAFLSGFHLLFGNPAHGLELRAIWLRYARVLVAALTFLLAADILESLISNSWETVARLGAVAVIRTVLNYFLERDLAEVRELQRAETASVETRPGQVDE